MSHVSLPANFAASSPEMEANNTPSASITAGHRRLDISPARRGTRSESCQAALSPFSPQQPNATKPVPGNICSIKEAKQVRREGAKVVLSATAMSKVVSAARTCIRTDYIHFLEMNLPHWNREGLWRQTWPPNRMASLKGYEKLQNAYSCVCRLDMRIGDDPIRSRIAMIFLHLEYEKSYCGWKIQNSRRPRIATRVGRGNASSMIDNILANTHPEWRTSDARGKAELRANFHDRKRYGKRWLILVNALGPAILVLSSSKFAGMMYGCTFAPSIGKSLMLTRTTVGTPRSLLQCLRQWLTPLKSMNWT